MVGWHHRLSRHASERTPGDNEGQGSLAAVHGHKEPDATERLDTHMKEGTSQQTMWYHTDWTHGR